MKRKRIKKFILPAAVLFGSSYLSILFTIGAFISYLTCEMFLKKFVRTGKVRLLIFGFRNWEIHIHHWFMGFTACLVLITAYIFGFIHSIPVFLAGILSGMIVHDVYTDKRWNVNKIKWYKILYRKNRLAS